MVFVTADSDRTRLEALTKRLVSAFPGSTIYQHTDLFRAPHDILHNRVDAVFVWLESPACGGLEVMRILRRQKADLRIFALAQSDRLRDAAAEAGATGYLLQPIDEQLLKEALLPADVGEA